jgi:hypothetical protein
MKVLIVSQAFYPEVSPRSFRATELAKEFSRQGHEVKVITYYRPGQESLFEAYNLQFKTLGEHKFKPLKMHSKGILRLWSRFWTRMLLWLSELYWMVKRAIKNESGYDLLISVAVPFPIHWGVAARRRKKGDIAKVWVADCGDPFMGQENDTFKPMFYFEYVEKWFCRRADFLTVPTEGAIKAYYPEFHDKIRVIPQGFKFEDVKRAAHHGKEGKIIFGYGGMFIPGKRDPSEFLEYLIQQEQIDYEFHIYTATPQLASSFVNRSQGRIKVFEPINRDELLFRLSSMDFVVNFENVGSKQTPSKLIDYAIIEKPILSIKTGELDKENLLKFLKNDFSDSIKIENTDQYKIEKVVLKFIEIN